jgi:IS4 transposase
LADANEAHDWRIWADLAQALIAIARPLYAHEALDADLEATVYALDSSTIDLCLALFPWARFQRTKSAIKLHTLLDLRGSIPTFVRVTAGRRHDVQVLDEIVPEAGSFYVMDRGYLDFARLYVFVRCSAFYVVRCKKNVRLDRRYSHPAAIGEGVLSDHTVVLRTRESSRAYPEALRRVRFHDSTTGKQLVLLTNNFELEAVTIARLYKARWRVELFFKWIKQHLRVKAFYGLGENAVKTQIWIAIATYLLVAILKKRLGLEVSLYKLLQVLSITVFEKTPVLQAFQRTLYNLEPTAPSNQLKLLDL